VGVHLFQKVAGRGGAITLYLLRIASSGVDILPRTSVSPMLSEGIKMLGQRSYGRAVFPQMMLTELLFQLGDFGFQSLDFSECDRLVCPSYGLKEYLLHRERERANFVFPLLGALSTFLHAIAARHSLITFDAISSTPGAGFYDLLPSTGRRSYHRHCRFIACLFCAMCGRTGGSMESGVHCEEVCGSVQPLRSVSVSIGVEPP
jgi:hypothetical protein